jgi:glycosyltransferase involved in cell wall biosynthesis
MEPQPHVSVLIVTYKRAFTLKYVLEGLKQQTYQNFELVIVLKLSGDATLHLLDQYSKDLRMKVVIQKYGFVTEAYNLGLEKTSGKIVAFLDDDAIPYPNWLEEHVALYCKDVELGGVSGPAKSVRITRSEGINQLEENYGYSSNSRQMFCHLPWMRPIHRMSNWLIFLGKDGLMHHHPQLENEDFRGVSSSLLHMGANMSVRKKAVEDLQVNENLMLGFAFEQILSYQIWRLGYTVVYTTNAVVSHIVHDESMGRFFKNPKRAALRDAEFVLTFSILKSQEKELKWIAFLLGIITLIVSRVKKIKEYGFITSAYRVYGLLCGFVAGSALSISKLFGRKFNARAYLSRLL